MDHVSPACCLLVKGISPAACCLAAGASQQVLNYFLPVKSCIPFPTCFAKPIYRHLV
jgi:hypothetical protein